MGENSRAIMKKRSNVSNILDAGDPDFKGLLGDLGIGGVAGGAATLPATARDALELRSMAKRAPEEFSLVSDMTKAVSGKSLPNIKLRQYLRSGGKGALVGGGIAGLISLLLGARYGMNSKQSHDKQLTEKKAIGILPLLPLATGAYGAYKAPAGKRPEGFGRGAFQGVGAGLGGALGAGLGGLAGGALGSQIADPRRSNLPTIVALLGALAGGYGGGRFGWRAAKGITGDNEELEGQGETQEEKKSSDLARVKFALDKEASLANVLGGLGSALGHGISGGVRGWANLVGKGLKAPGAVPKATAVAGGGLSLAALNELLAATKGGPIELPHIGMGSDHPLWDPMMQHDRIDPKKTGFKSLFHMATRPLQTAAVLTGMAKKPSGLSDYARAGLGGDNRLSSILTNPQNFRVNPLTGRGVATGEVPFSLDSTLQEQISDFNRQRERLEAMGIVPRRAGSSSTLGSRPHTSPFRGRFD